MKTIDKLLHKILCCGVALSTILITACNRDEVLEDTIPVSMESISRMDLSPNGPVLIANGDNELRFFVECFYFGDAEKTEEKRFLNDRLDLSQITIESSDGQTFKANEAYRTRATTDSVRFTAIYRGVRSPSVAVALRQPDTSVLPRLRIPIVFTAVYSNRASVYLNNFDEALLQKVVDRANRVFAGKMLKTPSSVDTRIEFYIKTIRKRNITEAQDDELADFMAENFMTELETALHVWVLDRSALYGLRSANIKPRYTLGNPSDIPGLGLKQVTAVPNVEDVAAENAVLIVSYGDLYQNDSGRANHRFETLLGRYYGLLSPSMSGTSKYTGQDVDYCADTYDYDRQSSTLLKHTLAVDGQRSYVYDSYNIMDTPGACLAVSYDQAKRIRQVIKDCPYRQHAEIIP